MEWSKSEIGTLHQGANASIVAGYAVVYSVWMQRNNFIHNHIAIPPATIFKDIDRQVVNSISTRKKMNKFRNLMSLWLHFS